MQWLFDIVIAQMVAAGFIKLPDVELYLKGMIVVWSGYKNDVPDGWAVCDGDNGTPDLKGRFIETPVSDRDYHQTGGDLVHTHDFTGDGHFHGLKPGPDIQTGTGADIDSKIEVVTGTTDQGTNTPPYYFLAFIMKL